jgi:hypothetical protein
VVAQISISYSSSGASASPGGVGDAGALGDAGGGERDAGGGDASSSPASRRGEGAAVMSRERDEV